MSDPRAGWYPDTQIPGGERYWDGAQWTQQRRDGQDRVPPPPPPPPPRRTWGTVVGRTVAALVVVVVIAVLMGRGFDWLGSLGSSSDNGGDDGSDASNVDCGSLAKQAVDISKDKDVQLLKVRNPVVKLDNRNSYQQPTGNGEALILSCTGQGVWSSGGEGRVLLRYTIDSDGDTFVAYLPQ